MFGLGDGTVGADGCWVPPRLYLLMGEGEGAEKVDQNESPLRSEEKGEGE